MTEATAKKDKYDFIGGLYSGKQATTFATIILTEQKNKRFLVEPSTDGVFNLYVSKIGGLLGKQVHDLDNYEFVTTLSPRAGQYGTFYTSPAGKDGKCFLMNSPKGEKKFTYILLKEKEPFKRESDKVSPEPASEAAAPKPRRTFA